MTRTCYIKVTIRLPVALKSKFKHAAASRGVTINEFINNALESAVHEACSAVCAGELTERDSAALLAVLKKPRCPNAAMRKAARRYRELTGGVS